MNDAIDQAVGEMALVADRGHVGEGQHGDARPRRLGGFRDPGRTGEPFTGHPPEARRCDQRETEQERAPAAFTAGHAVDSGLFCAAGRLARLGKAFGRRVGIDQLDPTTIEKIAPARHCP